jgi:hypothetical protein
MIDRAIQFTATEVPEDFHTEREYVVYIFIINCFKCSILHISLLLITILIT